MDKKCDDDASVFCAALIWKKHKLDAIIQNLEKKNYRSSRGAGRKGISKKAHSLPTTTVFDFQFNNCQVFASLATLQLYTPPQFSSLGTESEVFRRYTETWNSLIPPTRHRSSRQSFIVIANGFL